MSRHVQPLFTGSIDIVGDIHGEIAALAQLLAHLGYHDGIHSEGRRLVFVGDLCDRGPDSVAVVELVRDLVERERAQCILGNHELNVLREDKKHGNCWILDPAHPENRDEFACTTATPAQQQSLPAFFRTLPLALEREDLRVVHATWNDDAIETLRGSEDTSIAAFVAYEQTVRKTLDDSGLRAAGKTEQVTHKQWLADASYAMPLLANVGRCEEQRQMLNPVRVLTSGPERLAEQPFFANGKWRFCDRVRWWNEYAGPVPVVVGHYWRGDQEDRDISGGKPDVFEGASPADWLGPKRNVYCIDYSVGGRFRERLQGRAAPFAGRLAALRWPAQTVVFDDGTSIATAR